MAEFCKTFRNAHSVFVFNFPLSSAGLATGQCGWTIVSGERGLAETLILDLIGLITIKATTVVK